MSQLQLGPFQRAQVAPQDLPEHRQPRQEAQVGQDLLAALALQVKIQP